MSIARKWSPGESYGIVLQPTDLYLLGAKVLLHPILSKSDESFQLDFNVATGETVGHKGNGAEVLSFTMKDEAATLPRLTEIIIISRLSPWCTIVRNPGGVSLADVCATLWKEYADTPLTDIEFDQLSIRDQDRVKRAGLVRESDGYTNVIAGNWGTTRDFPINRCKRVDWLYGRVLFDGLERDDEFAKKKLGYSAPNIFRVSFLPL